MLADVVYVKKMSKAWRAHLLAMIHERLTWVKGHKGTEWDFVLEEKGPLQDLITDPPELEKMWKCLSIKEKMSLAFWVTHITGLSSTFLSEDEQTHIVRSMIKDTRTMDNVFVTWMVIHNRASCISVDVRGSVRCS
jgi:hypothetical protein